jgi:holo-[acyl-carrier protein] synthase
MIIGIGTDIVQIPRIEKLLTKFNNNFVERILFGTELDQYNALANINKASFIAKRFAAKEAIAKAFGTGIGFQLRFHDIIISNDSLGKPSANIISDIAIGKNISISISDDYPIAIAFVVISQ